MRCVQKNQPTRICFHMATSGCRTIALFCTFALLSPLSVCADDSRRVEKEQGQDSRLSSPGALRTGKDGKGDSKPSSAGAPRTGKGGKGGVDTNSTRTGSRPRLSVLVLVCAFALLSPLAVCDNDSRRIEEEQVGDSRLSSPGAPRTGKGGKGGKGDVDSNRTRTGEALAAGPGCQGRSGKGGKGGKEEEKKGGRFLQSGSRNDACDDDKEDFSMKLIFIVASGVICALCVTVGLLCVCLRRQRAQMHCKNDILRTCTTSGRALQPPGDAKRTTSAGVVPTSGVVVVGNPVVGNPVSNKQ